MIQGNIRFIDALKLAAGFGVVAIALVLTFVIIDILLTFLVAVMLAIALDRPIDKLVEKRIPRSIAAVTIYLAFLIGFCYILFLILPPLAQETRNFAANYPVYLENLLGREQAGTLDRDLQLSNISGELGTLSDALRASSQAIISTLFTIFGGLISFFVIFFVALFLNIQEDGVRHFISLFVPTRHSSYATSLFEQIQNRVSAWLLGKTLSSLLVGILIYIGLLIIGVPYAIILSVLAIFLNFIPYAGPIIAALPAILLGLIISPLHAIAVTGLYIFINSILETFVFIPVLMRRTIQINPALLILFVLIGGRLGGILGLIISIPVAAIVALAIEEYLSKKDPGTS